MSFLKLLRQKNNERQLKWSGSDKVDVLFRAVEFAEESGEVLGAVKKYHRALNGIVGNQKPIEDIRQNLEDEMGDVLITLDLLAKEYGIDLEKCAREKFNKTSRKNNIDVYFEEV